MSGADIVRSAHPTLARVLRCVESTKDRTWLAVANDSAVQAELTKAECQEALGTIDQVLANSAVSNADIKGLLNRIDAWQYDSPFGGDAKAARKHLEAARDAIADWIDNK